MDAMKYLWCCLLFLTAATFSQVAERVHVPSNQPELPFSNAVVVNDTIYLAGHSWVDVNLDKRPLKTADEARAVLEAIKTTLAKNDATMEDLVSVQVFCTDLSTYDAFNSVYRTYFAGKFPARAFIGVDKLLFNARFEVQGIAIKRRH
jgi:2-iminobutanoate/2-iminopropanoate deaminase